MAYLSKQDQAASSKIWYEKNKEIAIERKDSRRFATYSLGTFKHRRALFELQQMSIGTYLTPLQAQEAAGEICARLGFLDVRRATSSVISRSGCCQVGLLNGEPPFQRGTAQHEALSVFLMKRKRSSRVPPELFILQLIAKEASGR